MIEAMVRDASGDVAELGRPAKAFTAREVIARSNRTNEAPGGAFARAHPSHQATRSVRRDLILPNRRQRRAEEGYSSAARLGAGPQAPSLTFETPIGEETMIYGIWLALLGVLGAANLIISRRPDAKQAIGKIAPYQGWIGAGSAIWGAWGLISCVLSIGWMTSAPIYWFTLVADSASSARPRLPARHRHAEDVHQEPASEREDGPDHRQALAVPGHPRPDRDRPRRLDDRRQHHVARRLRSR